MEKIKLNISGNIVRIAIPEPLIFDDVKGQLREVCNKNYRLLKSLKFYQLLENKLSAKENNELSIIIESVIDLKSLDELRGENGKLSIIPDFKLHYGNLRSGEKLVSETNVIVLGNLNPGSKLISTKSIFVYGKARGEIHCGNDKNRNSFVFLKENEMAKVRIGGEQFLLEEEEKLSKGNINLYFKKRGNKVEVRELDEKKVKELLKEIGFELL